MASLETEVAASPSELGDVDHKTTLFTFTDMNSVLLTLGARSVCQSVLEYC